MESGAYEYANHVLVGMAVYLLIMLFIGFYASRKVESNVDFLVAGRRLGMVFCTGTLFATWFGSGTCMGGAGNAYTFGIQGVMFDPFGAALCLVISGLIFARITRRGRFLTLVDVFDIRYGRTMGILATTTIAISEIGWVGAQLVGFGTILHFFAGVPLEVGIGISTVLLIVYTWLGGMWAVTLTDVVQMAIIIVGLIVMLAYAVPDVGLDNLLANDTKNMMSINRWSFLPTSAADADPEAGNAGFMYYTGYMGWFYWISSLMAIGLGSIPAQDLMQRTLSARDEKVASYSSYIAAGMYCTVGLIPVLLGMIYFQTHPELTIEQAKTQILILSAVEHLPPALMVLFVSALVSALMSSSDSAILAASSCIGYNGYRYINPSADDAQCMRVVRYTLPVVTGGALILALYFQTIYNLMVVAWTLLLVSLVVPYFGAYFWKKANHLGALAAFFGGFAVWIGAYFVHLPHTIAANTDAAPGVEGVYFEWAMWDSLYISSVWGFLASILCLVVVSLLTQEINPPRPLKDVDGELLPTTNWMGVFSRSERA